MAYIDVKNLTKSYQMGVNTIYANQDLTFAINEGELVIILGASGAGKSTFLNLLGGMDQADSGQLVVDGTDLVNLSEYQKTEYRRKDVGFVFQFYNLIPNRQLPGTIVGWRAATGGHCPGGSQNFSCAMSQRGRWTMKRASRSCFCCRTWNGRRGQRS